MTDTPERTPSRRGGKSADAFRTISEVADELGLKQHVLRFWETRFPQIKPMKGNGGRRYYRPQDVALLKRLQVLLHDEKYTIKGVQKLLREEGIGKFMEDGQVARQDQADQPQLDLLAGVTPPVAASTSANAASAPAETSSLDASRRDALGDILAEMKAMKELLQKAG